MPILRGNITETVDITENGTHDVARFTSANVNVQGGAVNSVNGKTGDVILTAEDLAAIHSYESEEDVPQASADNLNQVIFFAGEQEGQLESHRFYQCIKYIRSLLLNNAVEVISFNGTPSTEPSITLSSYAIYNTISNNDGDDLNSDTIMLYINPVYDDNTGEQIVDYNIDLCYNKWYESMVAVQVGGGTISDLQTALYSLFGLTVDLSGYEEIWSFELKLPCEYGYNWSLLTVDNSLTWNTDINKWKTYPQGSVYWVTNGFGGVEYIANFTFNSKSLFIGCEGSGKPYFLSNDIDTSDLRVTVWYDPQGSYGTIFKVEFKEQSSALIVEGNYLAKYNESASELGLYTNEEMAYDAGRFIQALPNSGGDSLPSQAGNSGKFLTTDGTNASWATISAGDSIQVDTMPEATLSNAGKIVQYIGTTNQNYTNGYFYKCVHISSYEGTVYNATAELGDITINQTALNNALINTILFQAQTQYPDDLPYVEAVLNGTANAVFIYKNDNNAFWEFYDSTGGIVEPWNLMVQAHPIFTYTGTCNINDRIELEISDVGDIAWEQLDVQNGLPNQAGNSGKYLTTNGSTPSWATINTLPSQSGQSGKFLTTDGSTASWSDKLLVNKSTYSLFVNNYTDAPITVSGSGGSLFGVKSYNGVQPITVSGNNVVCVGGKIQSGSTISTDNWTVINGYSHINAYTYSPGEFSFAVYGVAHATRSIQIGLGTNNDANTVKISNANGNYELMSADGTIPTDRFTTTPSADGTYVPTLTVSSGVATRSWAAPSGGGSTATTGTLVAANWSSSSQTINVTGVTASNNVIIAPAPASQAAYTSAGIICTAQGSGTLTFTCTTTPSSDLTVNVLII